MVMSLGAWAPHGQAQVVTSLSKEQKTRPHHCSQAYKYPPVCPVSPSPHPPPSSSLNHPLSTAPLPMQPILPTPPPSPTAPTLPPLTAPPFLPNSAFDHHANFHSYPVITPNIPHVPDFNLLHYYVQDLIDSPYSSPAYFELEVFDATLSPSSQKFFYVPLRYRSALELLCFLYTKIGPINYNMHYPFNNHGAVEIALWLSVSQVLRDTVQALQGLGLERLSKCLLLCSYDLADLFYR